MDFEIRALTSIDEFRDHERLQQEVWGSEAIDVPVNLLAAGARHGALVLGAYSDGTMIGLLYGFPGLTHGRLHHHSHMLGVLPEHRRHGVGLALKLKQRGLVLEQGIDLITWTVDPLEVGNNLFNFGSLGVVCDTYLVDAYGEMNDALNRGLPSDRLEVKWWMAKLPKVVTARLTVSADLSQQAIPISAVERNTTGLPVPVRRVAEAANAVRIDVPLDFHAIRLADRELALRWRMHLRVLFTDLFARGYILVGCTQSDGIGSYTFHKQTQPRAGV